MNLRKLLLIVLFIFQGVFLYGQNLTVPMPAQVCFGEQGSIQATMSSGPGNNRRYRFDLYLNSSLIDRIISSNTSVTFTNLQIGTYSVQVYKVNNGGNNPTIVDSENSIVLNAETEAPIFQNPQSNIAENASSNACGAIVSYTYPIATDNCTVSTNPISGYTYLGTLNGHTYYYSNSTASATNAIQNSSNLGGHLVTIGSQAENNFIDNNVGVSIWIGITDTNLEGDFQWLTSEPIIYTNWNGGEPNNSGSNEDHTEMYTNGRWNDLRGTNSRRYVVEFQPAVIIQTGGLPTGSIFPIGTTTNTFLATDNSGNTAIHSFDVIVTDNTPPEISSLKADYYNGWSFNTLMETLNVSELNYNWGSGAPESNLVGTNDFSIRFQGNIKAPQTGTYTFYTTSDDGVRLWIDGTRIINNWTNHGPTVDTGTVNLTAGQSTPFQLEYYERGGGAVIKLEWEGPGLAREYVKDSGGGTCTNLVLDLSLSGAATIDANDIDPGYTDACGIATRVLSKTNFTCSDVGDNDVSLTVTDVNGNSSSCNVNIQVVGAPDNSLGIVGDTKCDNEDATVTIQNSELGVSYSLHLAATQIGSAVNGTGADLNIVIIASTLPMGNNLITIKASKGACELDLLNNATVVIVPKPSPVGIFHE